MRRGCLTLALWLAWVVGAYAQPPRVLLREKPGLRPDLCAALRIQLSGAAEVGCEPERADLPLSDRIRETATLVQARSGRLGVFLERDSDPRLVRMYIVGSRADQAALAVEKIEDRADHDVDRSLALKVGASLELVSRVETEQHAAPMPMAAALSEPAPLPTPRPWTSWALFLDLGGGVRIGPEAHGVFGAGLGASRVRPTWRLDLGAGVEIGTHYTSAKDLQEVKSWARGPALTVHALRRLQRFEWGGELVLGCSFLSAEGFAADGSRAERLLVLPSVALGLDLRVRLVSSAYLRLSPRLDIPFIDQTLRVDRTTVVDYPSVGVTVPLSLIFYLPLTAGGS